MHMHMCKHLHELELEAVVRRRRRRALAARRGLDWRLAWQLAEGGEEDGEAGRPERRVDLGRAGGAKLRPSLILTRAEEQPAESEGEGEGEGYGEGKGEGEP